mgnify:CR=1 FL=1|jgi:molecular chaperone HtpG
MSDAVETMEFQAEVGRLLRLMAHSVYSEKEIFLRELISNASDACDRLRYAAISAPELLEGAGAFAIDVRIDKPNRRLIVSDNGIGMDRDDLVRYLGSIAKSGAADFLETLEAAGEKGAHVIGQFGIGFYSTFMVADTVEVLTRKAGEAQAWLWKSDGEGAYTVETAEKAGRGTDVILTLKEGEDEYLEPYRLKSIIKSYSDHIPIAVRLSESPDGEGEQANAGRALWTLAKSEATDEQHKEFYAHVGGMGDGPWRTLHWKAEGTLEYAGLLYLPSAQPFNLFNPERKSRVKLYVRRVFITDEAEELLPGYLRFLVGVIDSEDLPLNVSREMLQRNAVLRQIRSGVVRRVLRELEDGAKEDPEGYAKFWENFGSVLKEGVYEDHANRDQLLKLCRFKSTSGDALVGLEDYVGRMKEGQEAIYYISGDAKTNLAGSPQLEGFAARGVEVLLLSDPVDDFWPAAVGAFDGKPIRSVTQGGADLDAIAPIDGAKADDADANIDALIVQFKLALGEAVKDVRVSKRLTESPVCLVADEGDMDLHLARMLQAHGQDVPTAARIMELNAAHPLVKGLNDRLKGAEASDEAAAYAHVLLDHARIAAGELPDDPALYSRRIAELLAKAV